MGAQHDAPPRRVLDRSDDPGRGGASGRTAGAGVGTGERHPNQRVRRGLEELAHPLSVVLAVVALLGGFLGLVALGEHFRSLLTTDGRFVFVLSALGVLAVMVIVRLIAAAL